MGRKALFRLPLRLSCGPRWDFSDSLSETVKKGVARYRYSYSSMHENNISNRPHRCRMELHRAPPSRSQSHRTSSSVPLARDPQRYLLRPKERLFVALGSSRLPTLAQRLPLLQAVPLGWNLGEDARRAAPAG